MKTHAQAEADQIKTLVGGTITGAVTSPDGESFGFTVSKGRRQVTVWVDCDPEGNGPGHLEVEQ